jgi:hypothetical protein
MTNEHRGLVTIPKIRRNKIELAFDQALINMHHDRKRVRCADPIDHGLWTSQDQKDGALAALHCRGCPVLILCRSAADSRREQWNVWGGHDYGSKVAA